MNSLTESKVKRQNILNNNIAIQELEKELSFGGLRYNGELIFTKDHVADIFQVNIRTIERYIETYKDELSENGYSVISGEDLKAFKKYTESFGTDINVGTKTTKLSIFNFKSILNLAMLMSDSDVAKEIRSTILDIFIDVLNQKSGGSTKYINQRDEDFIVSWFYNENYRKEFTDALKNYVDMGNSKYGIYTNRIYKDIFKEKAQEYKKILNLNKKDRIRDTMYSEVLDLISSYESGIAYELKLASEKKGRKLTQPETNYIFYQFHAHPSQKPLLAKARTKMASRDLAFREALHLQLENYIIPLDSNEFEKFLGEKSMELSERLEQSKDVLERLKNGE